MASVGTNGELVHVADFTPNRSGAILMQYMSGIPHRFTGTNNPGLAWGMMGGWTNHMSWVLFPGSGTNWCDMMDRHVDGLQPATMMGSLGGETDINSPGQTIGPMGQGMTGENGGSGGMGGMGGMGGTGGGWPAMTNWMAGMVDWWHFMSEWCWSYTNMWNGGSDFDDYTTNWWGSLGRGASHMMPMPGTVNMLTELNGLVIMNADLQPVLTADLANPTSFGYQVHCALKNQGILPGAAATLRASATKNATHFTLSASGLAPNMPYVMAINDTALATFTTDRRGRLQIRKLPNGVTSMRGIGSISIQDRNYTPILITALPPS
jgi:hypothetical protein